MRNRNNNGAAQFLKCENDTWICKACLLEEMDGKHRYRLNSGKRNRASCGFTVKNPGQTTRNNNKL